MACLPRVAAAALLVLAGCAGEPAGGPPEIQYGIDECSYCRMIVSEPRFAAAVVDETGNATRFDDVGCMLDYLRERPATPEGRAQDAHMERIWVHDYAAGGWIDAQPAWFVHDPRGTTPMGSGLVAFASRTDAKAYAAAQVTAVVAWQELVTRPLAE